MPEYTAILDLPQASRALLVGATGTGKSTLAELLMKRLHQKEPQAIMLYLDTKPRFQAEYELNGIRANKRYRKWGYGSFIPGSYVLPLQDIGNELDQVWRLGGSVAIAQAEHVEQWPLLAECARIFYERYGAKRPRKLYVDEQADFFEVVRGYGGIFQQIARSGRERNVTYVAASQRPRFLPKVLLTEVSRLYLFELDYRKDLEHLFEMGLPETISVPTVPHSFLLWDKKLKYKAPSGLYYKLEGV